MLVYRMYVQYRRKLGTKLGTRIIFHLGFPHLQEMMGL
jgi:hypothetical protein